MFHMHRYNHQDLVVRPHFHQDKALKDLKEILLKFHISIFHINSVHLSNLFLKKKTNYNSQK